MFFVISFFLPYIFLSSLKQFEALFYDIFSVSSVHPTTASARYKRLLTLESGNVEAPSGRRDLAGYMFLGVFVEISRQLVYIYSFLFGCFSKTAKKSQIIYFISTLPVTNSLHLKMDGWNTFSFPFGAFGVCLFSGATCSQPRPRPPWHVEAWELEISRDQRGWSGSTRGGC